MAVLKENVVLLHGLGRTARSMATLANHLEGQGYVVHNLDYPSRQYAVEKLCEQIHEKLANQIPPEQKVHFVGYSLGGLLVRLFLSNPTYRPKNLGRVVQLAPPNKGTDLADFWQHQWGYKKIYGPAGQQIITDQTKINHLFSPIDYELGVIAGTATANPISSLIIKGKNDGRVSVENTKVDGMKEHVVVHATHRFFPKNKKVIELTSLFLRNGTFN